MYAEERHQHIVTLAQRQHRVAVSDLAKRFEVTPETIRKDLDALAAQGVLRRVHGGAVAAEQLRLLEPDLLDRATKFLPEKRRIAEAALALVPQGASILLDGGTSTGALAQLLPGAANGLVVTNSPQAALQLSSTYSGEVHLLGGRVRSITGAAVGGATLEALRRTRVDIAFLGANGVSPQHGFSTPDPDEAAVKRAMIEIAAQRVVLADSSKIGKELLTSFAALGDVDTLITDSGIAEADLALLRQHGLEVLVA